MRRPYRYSLAARLILAVLFVGLLASCRVDTAGTTTPVQTTYPGPLSNPTRRPSTPVPSRVPATTVSRPTPVRPQPTPVPPQASTTAAPAPTPGNVAFSVTILHTGEVHGEVRPCG
jgi:hypothetical protein